MEDVSEPDSRPAHPDAHPQGQPESRRAEPGVPVYEHAWEDALEPRHLINRCDVILRVGATMLASGTGARRVSETMRHVAQALDLDSIRARISLTDIVLTVERRGITRTQTAQVPSPGVNADQIAALQEFARDLPTHVTVAEVQAGLDGILRRPKRWPAWAAPLGAGAACAAFAQLNHARPVEIAAVFVAAALGQLVRRALHRRHLNQLALAFLSAVVAALVFVGLTWVGYRLASQSPAAQDAGLIASVLFLVPGFPLMTAALDLARLDLDAGIARFTYAALLTFAAGFGVWSVAQFTGPHAVAALPVGAPTPAAIVVQAVASFIGVYGFAVIFNSPPTVALVSGLIASLANPVRLELLVLNLPAQNAAAIGTLLIGLLAWLAGRYLHLPRIILSVPSVVIMIPGMDAFRALVWFNEGQILDAMRAALTGTVTVLGMAVGLVAARMLTDAQWSFSTPNPPSYTAWVRRVAPHARRRTRLP